MGHGFEDDEGEAFGSVEGWEAEAIAILEQFGFGVTGYETEVLDCLGGCRGGVGGGIDAMGELFEFKFFGCLGEGAGDEQLEADGGIGLE